MKKNEEGTVLKFLALDLLGCKRNSKSFDITFLQLDSTVIYLKSKSLSLIWKHHAQEHPETADGLAWVGRKRLVVMDSIQIHN